MKSLKISIAAGCAIVLVVAGAVLLLPLSDRKGSSQALEQQPVSENSESPGQDSQVPSRGAITPPVVADQTAEQSDEAAADPSQQAGALAAVAADSRQSLERRRAALRQLQERGGAAAVAALLALARDLLQVDETSPIAQEAASAIAGLTGPESVEVMGEILTDRSPDFSPFADLPATMQDSIRAGLRKNPDELLVAKSLGGQFSATADPLAHSRIEMLEHPETTARLSVQALSEGNVPLLQERLAMLETTRDPRVYDAVVRLAEAGSIDRSRLDELAFNWAARQPESVDLDRLLAEMNDPSGPSLARSMAALSASGYASAEPDHRTAVSGSMEKLLNDGGLDAGFRGSLQRALQMLESDTSP